MMFFICLLTGIFWFYSRVYVRWEYRKKFTFKLVLFYGQLVIVALNVWALVVQVEGVADDERYRTLAGRLQRAEFQADRGEYAELSTELSRNMDYEEEFDYLWERTMLYAAGNRYLIYQAAVEAGMGEAYVKKAEQYRELLLEKGNKTAYQENEFYGAYFLKKVGLFEEIKEPEVEK